MKKTHSNKLLMKEALIDNYRILDPPPRKIEVLKHLRNDEDDNECMEVMHYQAYKAVALRHIRILDQWSRSSVQDASLANDDTDSISRVSSYESIQELTMVFQSSFSSPTDN